MSRAGNALPSRSDGHVSELDGLRAIAILGVLATHLLQSPPADPHALDALPAWMRAAIDEWYLCVDLFFALSGYLITSILLRTRENGAMAYFGAFYERRARRILPLYCLVLAVIAFFTLTSYLPFYGLAALLSINLAKLLNIAAPSAAGPFWSLAVEEQFYFIWPLVVLWLPRRLLLATTIAIVILEPIVRYACGATLLELTWFHSDGLAAGAAIAVVAASRGTGRRPMCLVAALFVAGLLVESLASVPLLGRHDVHSAIRISQASLLSATAIALAIGLRGAAPLAFLRMSWMRATATWSYCLYVVHRPLVEVFGHIVPAVPVFVRMSSAELTLVRAACVLAGSFATAALSWRFFERPILQRGRLGARL